MSFWLLVPQDVFEHGTAPLIGLRIVCQSMAAVDVNSFVSFFDSKVEEDEL